MEEIVETIDESTIGNFELQLNQSAKEFLKETSKWAYFLSILGFIGVGFVVLAAVFSGALFANIGHYNPSIRGFGMLGGSFITAIYLIVAALYFFPIYYLNRFASKANLAIKENNSELLATSFKYLKSHFKYIGVMVLIILCLYIFIFASAIIAAIAVGYR